MLEGGQPGNTNGTKSKRVLADALKRELAQRPERVVSIIKRLLDEAEAGEAWAMDLVFERVDGKLPQPIVGDSDEPGIKFAEIIVRAIAANADNRLTREGE